MQHTGAISIAPFILRIVLGIVFVWAGLGKVMDTFPVQGEQAARLANMGVFIDTKAQPTTPPPTPANPAPSPKPSASRDPSFHLASLNSYPPSGQQRSAEDYPNPVQVMTLYHLALDLDAKANTDDPKDAKGNPTFRLWPQFLGKSMWPLAAAWACTIAEVGCGTFLLVGLLTRFFSFVLLFNMLVAAWLTVIGPAIQSGNTRLGFLPNYPVFGGGGEWMVFLVQFILIGALLALLFAGSGGLSLDRALFGGPSGSRPAPAKDTSKDQ
jgi:uncharacterized membrane protein YphA (DoxX/SURF4 family)